MSQFVITSALHRNTDIAVIIARLSKTHPAIEVEQLSVKHPGIDDDGLWTFKRAGLALHVDLESSFGNCPFIVENTSNDIRREAKTVDQALSILIELLCAGAPTKGIRLWANGREQAEDAAS